MLDTYLDAPPDVHSGRMDSGAHPELLRSLRSRSGDQMRFLLIANDFPNPYQPTKGLFNLYLTRALSREHEVRVVSPIPWMDEWTHRLKGNRLDQTRSAILDGVEVHYPRYYYPPKVLRHCYGTFYWRSIRATVRRLLGSYLPDAVNGYWVYPDSQVASRVARLVGAPAAAIVGGSDVLLLPRHRRWRQRIVDTLHQADAVLTVSEHLKGVVTGLGVSAEKCHVWSQGVDTSLFAPGDRLEARRRLGIAAEEKALVWVGRMHPVKGLDVLLESCAILRRRGQPFHLYLVGGGSLEKSLKQHACSRELTEYVTFVGSRQHHQLPDWYRAAELTVLPSWSEGLPNVLRESLACGTPFVASRVGGIPEITDATSSRLVPPGDPVALAEAIAQELAEPRLPTARSRSSGWAESAQRLVDILRPVVAARRTHGQGNCALALSGF